MLYEFPYGIREYATNSSQIRFGTAFFYHAHTG